MINSTLNTLLRKYPKIVKNYAITHSFYVVLFWLLIISCEKWGPNEDKVLARVGSVYLYDSDIKSKLFTFKSSQDSILRSRVYIDSWARNQLLLQQSKINLNNEQISNLENLINQYRLDLYSNTYKNSLINKSIDSLISEKEIDSFLFKNKNIFKLNAPLYQVRYINLPHDNIDQKQIQKSFERYNNDDKSFLDSLSFQYFNYILKDSVWFSENEILYKIKFLSQDNLYKYIKKSKFFEIEDSMGVYLFYVNDHLEKGDVAPKAVINSTIKNIIINQRKLKLTKQLEKDILKDAIKSNSYEIY